MSNKHTNGILVVDINDRRIVGLNRKFIEMWDFSSRIISSQDENLALEVAAMKLEEPLKFITQVEQLYINIELEIHDIIKLKDGRIFERHSLPQYLESKSVARLWMFRDITQEMYWKNLPTKHNNKILYVPGLIPMKRFNKQEMIINRLL